MSSNQGQFFNSTEEAIAFILSRNPGTAVPIGKSFSGLRGGLMLAIPNSDGSVDVEGWISTPKKDIEKDEIGNGNQRFSPSGRSANAYNEAGPRAAKGTSSATRPS